MAAKKRAPELVVAVNRDHLNKLGVRTSSTLQDVKFVDTKDYALLPRDFADNKLPTGVGLGSQFAQVLPYTIVRNVEGKILTYQRKGSEEGLRGFWSIGAGGHITQQDLYNIILSKAQSHPTDLQPSLGELIVEGFQRELSEELGITIDIVHQPENPLLGFDSLINMSENIVDRVHVAYVYNLNLTAEEVEALSPAEDEFLDWHWATAAELREGIDNYRNSGKPFENWSRVLIEEQVDEL